MRKKKHLKNKLLLLMAIIFLVVNFNMSYCIKATNNVPALPSVTISNSTPGMTDKVDVTIENGGTDGKAWIGIYNENDAPGDTSTGGVESIWWKYLVDDLKIQNGNGKFTLDLSSIGLEAGKTYKLVLFKDGGYNIATSVKFQTIVPKTPTNPQVTASLTMPNTLVGMMDTVEVDIANASTDPGAWVGIYNENDKPGSEEDGGIASMWWKSLSDLNIQNGKFYIDLNTITGRERGKTYKLILFRNSGYTIDATVEFKISQPELKKYSLESVQVKTQKGKLPNLPTQVKEDNSNGKTSLVNVTWDKVDSDLYSKAGSFTVEGTVAGTVEKARADVEVVEGSGPLYTFDILSDTHLTSNLGFIHDLNFDYALKEMNKLDPSSSGLIINGDTVDSGLEENWKAYAQILNQNKHPKVDLSLGNHDTWQDNYWIDQSEYEKSKENFQKYSGKSNVYYDDWINGSHFIFLGSEQSDGNTAYFSDDQLKWFDKTLAENAANNKPIFVFIHQPLHNTVAGSKDGQGCGNDLAQDTKVRQILANYPQAILFTGHTHWEFGSKDIMYNSNYCTMFNIPSCGYCWTDANTEDDISEGYYVEVYKDKVLVKGRNFTNREWDRTAEYQVNYAGTSQNALIGVQNNNSLADKQLNKLSLTADKTTLINGIDTAKLTLKAFMSDGSNANLSNAVIQYSSNNINIASVNELGIVTPTGIGTVNITARVTLNGVTESVTQQINVEKVKTNANLSEITIDGKSFSDFAEDTLKYTITLPAQITKVPTIAGIAEDSDARVTIIQAKNINGTAVIIVTSADGTVTKNYMISFKRSSTSVSTVENPVFSLDSGKVYNDKQSLTISCSTQGAIIRYTTDGTDPNEKSQVYSGPIALSDITTVRAVAMKPGLTDSEIVSQKYNIEIPTGTEIIQNGDFSNGDKGWTHYNGVDNSPYGVENGMYKTTVGQVGDYDWSVQLNQGDFALKKGVTYRLTFNASANLSRNIEAIVEQDITNDHPVYLSKIVPITSDMNTYSFDFTMPADEAKAHVVFCMGNVDGLGFAESHDIFIDNVSLRDLPPIVSAPTFNVENGIYSSPLKITISSDTAGATIRYTTDGTNPTATSKVYTGPIIVSSNEVIKAYASKDGHGDSNIVSAVYSIYTPVPPITEPQTETRAGSVSMDGSTTDIVAINIIRTTDSNGIKTDNVELDEDKVLEIVKEALKTNSKTATIDISEVPGSSADKIKLSVASASMPQLINSGIELNVQTGKAQIQLPINTMNELNNQDLKFEIDNVEDGNSLSEISSSISELVSGGTIIGTPITMNTNYLGRTKIIIPFKDVLNTSKAQLSLLAVMVKYSDGEIKIDKGTIVYDKAGNAVGVALWVNKFGSFTLIEVPKTAFDGTTTVFPYKVSANKEWQIKFSKEVDKNTINSDNIYVLDSKGNKVAINISYGSDNILRISPVNSYISGETYSLYISKKVSSKEGEILTNTLKYNFIVE